MERIDKTFEIGCPVRAAYNQWTQFEEFPRFMDGVKEVRQLDDTHLHWCASVAGKDKEWDAEITDQVPDQLIAWRSTSGAPSAGQVRFDPISADRTRVQLSMEYEPETAVEKAGDALGVLSRKVDKTVEDFKEFIEHRGRETGGWRGEVHGGRTEQGSGTERSSLAGTETTGAPPTGAGLTGAAGAGSPASRGAAPGAAGGAMPGATGGTPAPGGGKPGTTPRK